MEVARWICFHIYSQNPYIKPPRAKTPTSYLRLPWEVPDKEEAEKKAQECTVAPWEVDKLNEIFAQMRKSKEEQANG